MTTARRAMTARVERFPAKAPGLAPALTPVRRRDRLQSVPTGLNLNDDIPTKAAPHTSVPRAAEIHP
jgi:hypothetical protein